MIGKDLEYAIRALRRTPIFSAFAVCSLTLGIAANVAIFSIVNGVLLKSLALADPDQLFGIVEIVPAMANLYPVLPANPRHAEEWKRLVPGIESLGLARGRDVVLEDVGRSMRVPAQAVTPDLLTALRVQPVIGRSIQRSDAQEGRDHVVLLAHSLWREAFGADPNIVGRDLRIDGIPHSIIGVMPPAFRFPLTGGEFGMPLQPELYTPLWFHLARHSLEGDFNYAAIARLKPGVRRQTVLAALNTAQAALVKAIANRPQIRADLIPLQELAVQKSRTSLLLLLSAVATVLVIVCLNLATLMLARVAAKGREVAIRVALGASRWRMIRLALIESSLLAGLSGAFGVSLARLSLRTLVAVAPASLPRLDQVEIDRNVVLFSIGLVFLTSLLLGLYPAWRQSRRDPQEALVACSRSSTVAKSGARARNILIGMEVGLSTLLLAIGGLLLASFARLMNSEPGFALENRLSAHLNLPGADYDQPEKVTSFYDKLLGQMADQPGIRQVALISQLPLTGENWIDRMWRPGDTRPMFQKLTTNVRFISGSYFATLSIPLIGGRSFEPSDKSKSVIVISGAVADSLWPGENPIGQNLVLENRPMRVIGVVGDTRADAEKRAPAVVYVPYWDASTGMQDNLNVVVRSSLPTHDAVALLRRVVANLDFGVPISDIKSFNEIRSDALAQRRFQILLVSIFAASALIIAMLGIFGVITGVVLARRSEIGIRMALGASAQDVTRMVVCQGMPPVLAGLLAGLTLTLLLHSAIRNLLYEVHPADPLVLVAASFLLTGAAALACWIPARRAASIDPMEALRYE